MSVDLCDAVYIDDRFGTERWVYRDELLEREAAGELAVIFPDEPERLQSTVRVLFNVCKRIYLCHSNQTFAAALADLNDRSGPECTPIFAFIDVESTGGARRQESREFEGSLTLDSATPFSGRFTFSSEYSDSYGVQLLALLASDLQLQDGPKLITPIAMMRTPEGLGEEAEKLQCSQLSQKLCATSLALPSLPSRCIDAGAADVLCQPLQEARVQGLLVHAYRVRRTARKEMTRFLSIKKSRKQSWVGVNAEKPYSYIREAMVSKLLESICHPDQVIEEFQYGELNISAERKEMIEREVGVWRFPVHHLTDDELVYAACTMIGHAMTMPEVGPWRLTKGELQTFLLASRAAYNSFVLYHNFRHAVDVLQSVFYILIRIGALPTYDISNTNTSPSKSPVASLITPFDALSLLIAAIGHDVGHPGVNNVFLVKLNAPLAQLYNDSSVLEAFHCAAFSQILRRHWPAAFHDAKMRKLLISSILATDMGVHFTFMGRMAELQRKCEENSDITSWTPQDRDTYKTLVCGLIIKCADISNVARPWKIAEQWTNLLQEEFAHQGEMEKEIGMETALFGGPPELGNIHKLSLGQINFMSIFALPLFEGVAGLCPEIISTVKHIKLNRARWQEVANDEETRMTPTSSGERSPRSLSPPRRESLKVSTVQENDVSTDRDANAHIILDEPPELTNTAPSLTVQKDYANDHIDLSQTTIAGFSTSANGTVKDEPSSESQSSDDGDSNTGDSSGATLMTHSKAHYDRASSSDQASRPTSSYGVGRDTRTQSASTTTNTVATPVSPATNATSFVTLDSSDDKESRGSGLSSASDVYPLDDNHSRPSSSGLYGKRLQPNGHVIPPKPRSSQGFEEFGKSHHLMTAILGNSGNDHDHAEEKLRTSHRSHEQLTSAPRHELPRKRSRLRLAFWRRKS
ncbi:high affinity cAMP phosphodiesterase, putative [Talaromyces stipitatus ATCC 10500]|uniref:Phosphodiesterase n=1 Tax=Talaromyces stipitatus (strain ATCC 10500 / CBS 375.48 / QM 6759 / NRRL 1006) TaxID=441959 RepID=B8MH55_TALSN|nr:high affinity cAMP phosphodiesterase, putative [Talaromyces stipitatus ATCC 10500]EED16869.1 high affinity cAMP phosphodiesterase, putative [Talaromyces stipitatus ATCC 10500]